MRDIKFRGFNKTTGEMFNPMPIMDFEILRINGVELMQFIGLPDKKGKEIYEGDVVRGDTTRFTSRSFMGSFPKAKEFKGVVEYSSACFSIKFLNQKIINSFGGSTRLFFSQMDEIEIIGNIYEHPELIENIPAEPQMKTR